MAGPAIDIRDNPRDQIAIAQSMGRQVGEIFARHQQNQRRQVTEQSLIRILNDPNMTPRQKRQAIISLPGVLGTTTGQSALRSELADDPFEGLSPEQVQQSREVKAGVRARPSSRATATGASGLAKQWEFKRKQRELLVERKADTTDETERERLQQQVSQIDKEMEAIAKQLSGKPNVQPNTSGTTFDESGFATLPTQPSGFIPPEQSTAATAKVEPRKPNETIEEYLKRTQ